MTETEQDTILDLVKAIHDARLTEPETHNTIMPMGKVWLMADAIHNSIQTGTTSLDSVAEAALNGYYQSLAASVQNTDKFIAHEFNKNFDSADMQAAINQFTDKLHNQVTFEGLTDSEKTYFRQVANIVAGAMKTTLS